MEYWVYAEWLLTINVSTRKGSEVDGIEIYNNNFTDLKGGALDDDRAGRKAYDTGLKQITCSLSLTIPSF
ncbi:hypothetical protein FACS189451_11960 [Bacteroidia bacterium]|nr:hypothetical protein FACS189451_11960 [Bacteroidia bacterium]